MRNLCNSWRQSTLRWTACVGAALWLTTGCQPAEEIAVYQAPKPESIKQLTPVAAGPTQAGAAKQTLGAIAVVDDQGWFFKITGAPGQVGKQRSAFDEFLKSLTFAGPAPTWKLPSGWKQGPPGGIRFATLFLNDETPPLELSITRLEKVAGSSDDEYLLQNVNRWRNQLQLPPHADAAALQAAASQVEAGGKTLWVVDITGTEGQTGMSLGPLASGKGDLPEGHPPVAGPGASASAGPGTPPFAGPSSKRPPPLPLPAGQSLAKEAGFQFALPEGWSEVKPSSGFTTARFVSAEQDGRRVEITLSAAGGELLANVNRWRGQVGLPPLEDVSSLATVDLSGVPAKRADLIGAQQAILGVIAPQGERQWFIKLTGDADLAKAEQARFDQFLQSLQLPK